MSEDPLGFGGGDNNLFRYCGGDPVNRADPPGQAAISSVGPVIVYGNEGKSGYLGGATRQAPAPFGGPGTGFTIGSGTGGSSDASYTYSSSYTPTGSHIPQSRTARSVGNGLFSIRYHDAINGTHDAGLFALVSGGMFGSTPNFVPAALVSVQTVIEGSFERGTKTLQSVMFTPQGLIKLPTFTGTTNIGGAQVRGLAWYFSVSNGTTVALSGKALTAGFLAAGAPFGPLGVSAAFQLTIDYTFAVSVDFSRHYASVTGVHDAYPSYAVSVNGSSIYYFHETNLIGLSPGHSIRAFGEGYW